MQKQIFFLLNYDTINLKSKIINKNSKWYNVIYNNKDYWLKSEDCKVLYKYVDNLKNTKIQLSKQPPLYSQPPIKTKMYLIKGDKVEILEEKDDWLYILYKGKKRYKSMDT